MRIFDYVILTGNMQDPQIKGRIEARDHDQAMNDALAANGYDYGSIDFIAVTPREEKQATVAEVFGLRPYPDREAL